MASIISNSENIEILEKSFGKYLFNILKNGNTEDIINVDAVSGATLSRRELFEQSVKLAYIFSDYGISAGDKIAIVSENNINYVAVILAGLYTGVIVCPLNPSYSLAELHHGLLYAKPKLVICSTQALPTVSQLKHEFSSILKILIVGKGLESTNNDIETLDEVFQRVTSNVSDFQPVEINAIEDGALIFLSSGTTGMPKAVLLNQECLRLSVNSYGHPSYGNGASSKATILLLPFFHIFGLVVHLLTVASSTKGVIMSKFQPEPFLKSIQDYKVNLLYLVPPLVVFFAKSPIVKKYDLSSIQDIIVGGAPLSQNSLNDAEGRLGSVSIRQAYGVTELGCVVTIQPRNSNKLGTIGVLIPGFTGKVVKLEENTSVEALEIGELCFKSLGVMKGYLREDGLCRFGFDEDGFYHSGDLGYYDEDNYFYLVDRIKELIKCKGFQVAPAELEALILTHPDVKDCAVTSIQEEKAGELPLGLVVKKDNVQVTKQEIINYVAERISVQKHLYGGVQFVEEIPKNPSGKILRKLLKEMVKKC